MVFAAPEGQPGAIARACIPITSGSFTAPSTLMVDIAASGNPCDEARTTKTFPAGRYTLTAGVYVGGSQTPEKGSTQSFEVAGNVTVVVNGTTLSGD